MNKLVWIPKAIETTAMSRFMRQIEQAYHVSLPDYDALYHWSIQHPDLFWAKVASFFHLHFDHPPKTILKTGPTMQDAKWFEGATLNVAAHLLSRHDAHPALISVNEQGARDVLSYHTLRQHVANCAAGLRAQGILAGDRVASLLPNHAY